MFKKFLVALAVVLSIGASANAQDENSKKNVFVVYAGPQLSTASAGGGMTLSSKFSWLAGIQYERNSVFGEYFGLYGGIEYSAKGTKDFEFLDGHKDDYNLNYLQLNLGVKFAKEIWGIDGFAELGPYVAYGIGGKSTQGSSNYEGDSFGDFGENFGFKRFDAGLNVAIGADFSGFRIMAGYQRGFIDIADEQLISNGYKNYGFYAKVGYAF